MSAWSHWNTRNSSEASSCIRPREESFMRWKSSREWPNTSLLWWTESSSKIETFSRLLRRIDRTLTSHSDHCTAHMAMVVMGKVTTVITAVAGQVMVIFQEDWQSSKKTSGWNNNSGIKRISPVQLETAAQEDLKWAQPRMEVLESHRSLCPREALIFQIAELKLLHLQENLTYCRNQTKESSHTSNTPEIALRPTMPASRAIS